MVSGVTINLEPRPSSAFAEGGAILFFVRSWKAIFDGNGNGLDEDSCTRHAL